MPWQQVVHAMEGSPNDAVLLLTSKTYQASGEQQQAMVIREVCPECTSARYKKNGHLHTPTVSLDVISLVASSGGYYSIKSSNALRRNARCTWRHSEGSRNVHNTVIRRALSPLRSCGNVTADVHGCPRRVTPIRHPLAIKDTPVAHTGEETTSSPHHATGCTATRPPLFASWPWFLHTGCSLEAIGYDSTRAEYR